MKKLFIGLVTVLVLLTGINSITVKADVIISSSQTSQPRYRTHVQSYGWQNFMTNGNMSGTSGKAKRLEAIEIHSPNSAEGGITYQTHVQSYGWQDWVSNGQSSGTSGEAKRLEAIKIKLTGNLEKNYDVYYRVHAQSFGWLGWAKNGESSGTEGFGYRLEAIEIKVVPKSQDAPGSTNKPFVEYSKPKEKMKLSYSTHVQSYGWQSPVNDGKTSGTVGKAKRLEAIKINIENPEYNGGISYQPHVQSYGWLDWKSNNQVNGTSGQAKRLEAINIKLTGDMAKYFDVYYRVHSQKLGWLGWAKNGQTSGTSGLGYRLEGIEVQLVKKGNNPPGPTNNVYVDGEEKVSIKGSNRVKEILSKTDKEAYDLAKNLSRKEKDQSADLSQAELQQLADAIDYDKLNKEFASLINARRAKLGLSTLKPASNFVSGTKKITKTLADYGYIGVNGYKGHTLPNGKPTYTVFSQDLINKGVGENIAFKYNANNPYEIISEKFIVEYFFDQWMNSPSHKANMDDKLFKGFTIAAQPVVNGQTKLGTKNANGVYTITGSAYPHYGVGIIAVLTLVDNL